MSMDPDSIESKLEVAREKKATGDAAFKAGNLTDGVYYDHLRTISLASPSPLSLIISWSSSQSVL